MSQQELLAKVIEVLDDNHIDYMITGSIASSLQGEPRSTHDIDLVVVIPKKKARKLHQAFPPPDYYLSEEAMIEAIALASMFNLIHAIDGDKVDFWLLTDEAFDQSRFARKYVENVMGMRVNVSSPEDTILAKLHWAQKSGGSEKQFTDALRVYEVQYGTLDLTYLGKWVKELGLEVFWKRLQDEAETR